MNWISKKDIDNDIVNKLMTIPLKTNHFTNGGENVKLLEELPFNTNVPKSCDEGKPYCFDYKDDYALKFSNITDQITKKLKN